MSRSAAEHSPKPPQPPEFRRRPAFHLLQLIGVPLLLVLPVLAVFGVFGESFKEAEARGSVLELRAHYPVRTRHGLDTSMQFGVHNLSGQALPRVGLSLGRGYVESFADAAFTPSVATVDGEAYRLELRDLRPGETRWVTVDVRGDDYGRHRGTITATAGAGEAVAVDVSTFVFP